MLELQWCPILELLSTFNIDGAAVRAHDNGTAVRTW